MANQRLIARLQQGHEAWNAWREKNLASKIDLGATNFINANLSSVNLSGANLVGANLSNADLSNASFKSADLREAYLLEGYLIGADLSNANLESADLSYASLEFADLRNANLSNAYLIGANLRNANLSNANLKYANFRTADLCKTNLSYADLTAANLIEANLVEANLNGSQVLRTNFTQSTLSGACIADWQLGSSTILQDIKCNCVFRTYDDEKHQFSGRLPVDAESTFALGEFTQRFQIIASALETIDITFTEGIDWQAFFQSFQDLRASRPSENISIQGMERKGDAFIVRLEVQAESDTAAIETEVKQRYAHQLAVLEAQYEERLLLQGAHLEDARRTIELERQRNTELTGLIGIMAQNQGPKYDMRNSNFGQFVDTAQSGSRVQSVQHIYAPEQKDLSEAAKEIQALLNILAETYNTTTDAGKEQLMKELSNEVEKHPKWRRALKVGGIELIKVLCAPIGVPLEMARVYLESED